MNKKGIAVLAGLLAAAVLTASADDLAQVTPVADVEAQAHEAWRETIAHIGAPREGCFHTSYPSTVWSKVDCVEAPNRPYLPRHAATGETVGDGVDYVAQVPGLMTGSVGTFPAVSGVKTEKDGGLNVYSIQLNSNFMTTAVCNGIAKCLSWEQFVYSSSEKSAFMQYWLINYGKCPSGWITSRPDCYKNSAAVTVPKVAIAQLPNLKLSGAAVLNGIDTLVFTTETEAYSTTGQDSVVDLATGWNESEFNIIGDGGGSAATFNKGASITVKISVTNGSTAAPTCVADAGTTGETNNLTLKGCTASSGSSPYVEFVESD